MVSPLIPAEGPLRVALLLESDGPGGAETMLLNLGEELRRRGHDVLPLGPAGRTGWLAAQFRERGFAPESYVMRHALDPACARQLADILRSHRIQVAHSHEFTMGVYGAIAASRAGSRHIITMHGGRYYAERGRRRAAMRWAVRRSDALVAVSDATARDLRATLRLPHDAVAVVHNGIPFREGQRATLRNELGIAEDELLLVAVGNLYPVKGHAVLLRALGELRRSGVVADVRWRLAIAGRGEEEEKLRALATEEGLAERVTLLGFRSDVPDILAAADLFVMPSLSEGLPLALVEAMAAALPVVVSDVGGVSEVAVAGREAILVPPGDVARLAEGVSTLLSDPAARAALGAAARARAVRDFSVSTMCEAYERLYRGEVAARSSARDASARRGEFAPGRAG
ncbi:MAG TPA: glycosyltransferase [Gemmatimonadaceae bacterium]|jgi:glycosyltransferase involved in cell wall biosynthesis|nr:glycosyltransferase [Gemmatimonadaceae bacterium]